MTADAAKYTLRIVGSVGDETTGITAANDRGALIVATRRIWDHGPIGTRFVVLSRVEADGDIIPIAGRDLSRCENRYGRVDRLPAWEMMG